MDALDGSEVAMEIWVRSLGAALFLVSGIHECWLNREVHQETKLCVYNLGFSIDIDGARVVGRIAIAST